MSIGCTSTLSPMGSIRSGSLRSILRSGKRIRLARFLPHLAIGLFATYVVFLLTSSGLYTWNLLHPPCESAPPAPPGVEQISLAASSDVRLSGWWRNGSSGAAVILLGGHGQNRTAMDVQARALAARGVASLTMDYRNCAGQISTLGYREGDDLRAALDFLENRPGVERIGLWGFSVGGVAALRAAALDPHVRAVVAEGQYADLVGEMTSSVSSPLSFTWLVQRLVIGYYWLWSGVEPRRVSPLADLTTLARSRPATDPCAVLLIFGEKEVARTRAWAQFQAAQAPKQLWIIPNAGHGDYAQSAPQEYPARVVQFFQSTLMQP